MAICKIQCIRQEISVALKVCLPTKLRRQIPIYLGLRKFTLMFTLLKLMKERIILGNSFILCKGLEKIWKGI